jgi:hypothetical protein
MKPAAEHLLGFCCDAPFIVLIAKEQAFLQLQRTAVVK